MDFVLINFYPEKLCFYTKILCLLNQKHCKKFFVRKSPAFPSRFRGREKGMKRRIIRRYSVRRHEKRMRRAAPEPPPKLASRRLFRIYNTFFQQTIFSNPFCGQKQGALRKRVPQRALRCCDDSLFYDTLQGPFRLLRTAATGSSGRRRSCGTRRYRTRASCTRPPARRPAPSGSPRAR